MNRKTLVIAILVSLITFGVVSAQSPRRRTPARPAAPKPTPSPTPATNGTATQPAEPAPIALAIVNDVTVTSADIEPQVTTAINSDPDLYLQAFYQDREKEIKEARQRAVDARISSLMIAADAKKRSQTVEEFLNREVNNKIAAPSEAEITATYNASRDQLGGANLEKVRPDIINFLRLQRQQQLYDALLNRLKMTNTVIRHTDVNAPNIAPGTVLAAVNGQPIRIDTINERVKAYIYELEMRIYGMQQRALDRRINDLLLIAEANRRNVGSEVIVRAEITEKIKPPTEAEISKFYNENKARITVDLASARADITNFLEQQQQEKLESALSERLRVGAKLQVLLKEPEPPVLNVSVGASPSRGDANAAVTVIEFTDFQCSKCGSMYPIIEDVLKPYGSRVRFVIRDFPLTLIHANAFRAAQAASVANAQGKFWEYIDLLFKNQDSLDADSLKKYATQVGLDRKRFDAEFESGKYDADIRGDIEEGELHGIEGTPTLYINGVILTELSADALHTAIEKAFARAQKRAQ